MVDECGASVYGSSSGAAEEFPDVDRTMRSAIFLARRLLDPLSELVKVEPDALGVGLYQKDQSGPRLTAALRQGVENAVNRVGVDVNRASAPLLEHVSGISPKLAGAIVAARLAGPDTLLALAVDALLTPYAISEQRSRSVPVQHMLQQLVHDRYYARHIAPRLVLRHLSGDGNVPADLASRGLWEELAQLCSAPPEKKNQQSSLLEHVRTCTV